MTEIWPTVTIPTTAEKSPRLNLWLLTVNISFATVFMFMAFEFRKLGAR
jgi:hypothetical protein